MFIKKFVYICLYFVLVTVFAMANNCPKWLPLPADDGLVVIIPIYDESITEPDLDCDKIIDAIDSDIDGDGISNSVEVANGTNPYSADTDGDGISDNNDAFPTNAAETTDTDGDGIGNNADDDDDGDGSPDTIEIATGTDPLDANSYPKAFVITVKTDNGGDSEDNQFLIPTFHGAFYNYYVKCDRYSSDLPAPEAGDHLCTYDAPGTYTISIIDANDDGTGFPGIYFNFAGDKDKLVGINQWGTVKWHSMNSAFAGCSNLSDVGGAATDTPNLSSVHTLNDMFNSATLFNQDIGAWDTSNITSMKSMFYRADTFNQDIGSWDTSDVSDFSRMFNAAFSFNQDLSDWDTSHANTMDGMFASAISFTNQNLSSWSVANVSNRHELFMAGTGTNNIEPLWPDFIITVKTDNTGPSLDTEFMIPTYPGLNYNYNVDCNNDGVDEATGETGNYLCEYGAPGTYTIAISDNTGTNNGFPRIYFGYSGDKDKIVGINQWGTGKWSSMAYAFSGCTNLANVGGVATDKPNLSNVTSLVGMFTSASSFNQPIGHWDISNITDPSAMFSSATSFNQDIGNWNTSNVTNMYGMFSYAHAFNQNIENWDITNVSSLKNMFNFATSFNQPLNGWDVSSVVDMNGTFYYATHFNQPLGSWDTSNVTSMSSMFKGASSFAQYLGGWNTSSVTKMNSMFSGATAFNSSLFTWNTDNVTDMSFMFNNASSFNGLINFNTMNVTNMDSMFAGASSFQNRDLSGWNVSNINSHVDFSTGWGTGNTEPVWP